MQNTAELDKSLTDHPGTIGGGAVVKVWNEPEGKFYTIQREDSSTFRLQIFHDRQALINRLSELLAIFRTKFGIPKSCDPGVYIRALGYRTAANDIEHISVAHLLLRLPEISPDAAVITNDDINAWLEPLGLYFEPRESEQSQ